MKRILILALGILLYTLPAFTQQRWERTYGGTSSDMGFSVQQTPDSGYILIGYTGSYGAGDYDVWLIKTDATGETLWTKTYGGIGSDWGKSVQQTSDGGYIIAGSTRSFGAGDWDVYLIKTNASGDTLWTRTYGGANADEGNSVQQTSDGGFIVAGYTCSFGDTLEDVYLIKTNPSGDTLWTRTYGGTNPDGGCSVQQTADNGYIIAGYTWSFGAGYYDVYLIKTNASGDTLWARTYGGALDDGGNSVQQTSDGGYIIAGTTSSFGAGNNDVYVIKTNPSGDTLWTRTYGGTYFDNGRSIRQTTDGGYIVAGYAGTIYPPSWYDVYLIKTNATGDTLWTRFYGGRDWDFGYSVQQTTDGGYILVGRTTSFGAGSDDVYLIKTDSLGNSTGVEENKGFEGPRVQGFKVTPNPFTSFATVPGHEGERFSLYDISGRKVGTYRGDRVGEGLGPGVYFLRSSDSKDKPLRVVKVR